MAIIQKYLKTLDSEARILDKEDFKFYKEVLKKAKKDFQKGFQYISNNINPIDVTGSNFFFACLADELLGKDGRIATLNDWGEMLNGGNFAKGMYFDSNQLILRSDEATFDKNQYLINDLSKKLKGEFEYSPENPLIITGARLKSSKAKENEYGIDLDISNAEIKNDESFAPTNKIIKLGNIEKKLWTKKEGLSRLCLDENDVGSGSGNLADSDSDGRVALLDAIGVVEEKLAEYLIKLQEQKDLQISEIEKKYLEAKSILQNK